jgi:hypothetical protein
MPQITHQNALPLGSMLMEYRLESVLGAGGFGITYLAHDTNLEKDVAIKEYLPSAFAVRSSGGVMPTNAAAEHDYKWGLDRFIQEARTLAKFAHPHIVRVNRFFEANGTGYMVMDYEAGEPLKGWLQRHPQPSEPLLKALLLPLLDGLEKVHAAGFLHRDIKPDNIFVRRDGGPVLIDFGAARQAVGGATQTLTTIVSPGYAPFEQYTTTSEQGPWSDVYSLCGVLYFAVTGQNPPDAITRMKSDTVAQGLGAARMRYSGSFVDAITWGLMLEEGKRPRSVGELQEALFGRASQPAAASAPAHAGATVRTAPRSRPLPAVSAPSPHVRTERVERTAPAVTIIASREREAAGPSIWKWAVPAVVAVAVVGIGVRGMSGAKEAPRPTATAAATAPTAAARPHRNTASPDAEPSQTDGPESAAAVPTATDNPAPSATAPTPPEQVTAVMPAGTSKAPAADGVVAAAKPQATAPAAPSGGMEPALRVGSGEAAMVGMTKEELAKSYPQMAERFAEIDLDHDGRVEPQELVEAMQKMPALRQQLLQ